MALAAGVLWVLTPSCPALAKTTNDLSILEYSDTSLAVSWNLVAIAPTLLAPNHWQFTLPDSIWLGEDAEGIMPGYSIGVSFPVPGAGNLGPWDNVGSFVTEQDPYSNLIDVQCHDATT
jgi:hypothetical protein